MRDATLCYIFDGNNILLQKKAKGFGVGKWNAPGGKMNALESPEKAAIREVKEETGLDVQNLENVGILNFIEEKGKVFSVYVFTTDKFSGEIQASEEGKLEWFNKSSLPIKEMWEDDKHWIPQMLEGKKFRGDFIFNKGFQKLIKHKVINA